MLSEIRPLHDIAKQVLMDSIPDGKKPANMDRRSSKALELLAEAVSLLENACINVENQDEQPKKTKYEFDARWYW